VGDAGGHEAVEEAVLVAGTQGFDPGRAFGIRGKDRRNINGGGRHRGREGGFSQGHRKSPVRGKGRSQTG